MLATIEYDQEFVIGGVALALISRANAFATHSRFQAAKDVLEWALLLKPNIVTAWSGMAMVAFQMKDYQTAVYWSEKVLNFVPNTASDDIWESGAAELMPLAARKKPHNFWENHQEELTHGNRFSNKWRRLDRYV